MNNKHNLIFIVYNYFSFLYKMSAKLNFKFLLPTGPLYDRCKRKVVAIFISKVFGTFNMKVSPFANGNRDSKASIHFIRLSFNVQC